MQRKERREGGTCESEVKGRMVARVVPSRRVTGVGVKEGIGVVRLIGGDVGSSSIAGMIVVMFGGSGGWLKR